LWGEENKFLLRGLFRIGKIPISNRKISRWKKFNSEGVKPSYVSLLFKSALTKKKKKKLAQKVGEERRGCSSEAKDDNLNSNCSR